MRFHPELGPIPTTGVELEIARWRPGNLGNTGRYQRVIEALGEMGLIDAGQFVGGYHDYHCTCSTCVGVERSVNQYPIMFKAQRDASLPSSGVELISSPFGVSEVFMHDMRRVIELIDDSALWDQGYEDQRGRINAPGLHVHAHCVGPQFAGIEAGRLQEALNTFLLYAPELFTLADSAEPLEDERIRRGLDFRIPTDNGEHHAFVASATNPLRLEWRLWEIPYHDADYIEAAIYISAALTQLLHRPSVLKTMNGWGSLNAWDTRNRQLEHMLSEYSEDRMEYLLDVLFRGTGIVEDDNGREAIERLVERVS